MGLFSWMSSCGTVRDDGRPSLVQTHDVNPDDPLRQAAAEDLALIESDNRPADEANPEER
jgi:hypothetical protein